MDANARDTGDEVWAITGASGRIGTVLRRAMLPEVARLVLIDVVPPQQLDARESAPRAELGDPASLRIALQGVDGVVHLAAVPDEPTSTISSRPTSSAPSTCSRRHVRRACVG